MPHRTQQRRADRLALHELNQRYQREWDRAERLQAELEHIKNTRGYRLLCWARRWLRREAGPAAESPLVPFRCEVLEDCRVPATGTVSVIIPFKNRVDLLRNCLHGVQRTDEIVLVDHESTCPRTLRFLQRLGRRPNICVLPADGCFNFAKFCNQGARHAHGDFLLFLNNDVEAITSDWLEQLLQLACHPDIGVVGATLLYPDDTIQHAGIFPRVNGQWTHVGRRESFIEGFQVARAVPAVTGACLLIRRRLFEELRGFDENYPLTFNDVDLCCRVRRRGLKVALAPHARLYHFESLSRGMSRENRVYGGWAPLDGSRCQLRR